MTITTDRTPQLRFRDVPAVEPRERMRLLLLACGVLYSLLYVVANDVLAATVYDGYSRSSQAISELSAAGAPTQPMLAALLPIFSALLIAFGIGVRRSAGSARALRITGGLLMAQGITALLWLAAPMSHRADIAASGGSSADELHLVLSGVSLLFILSQIGTSALAFGRRFRHYAALTVATILTAGAITGIESSKLAAGEPTPWLGVAERISLGGWLLWLAVLAIALAAREPAAD